MKEINDFKIGSIMLSYNWVLIPIISHWKLEFFVLKIFSVVVPIAWNSTLWYSLANWFIPAGNQKHGVNKILEFDMVSIVIVVLDHSLFFTYE